MAPGNIFSIPEIVRIILDPFGVPEKDMALERQRRATLVVAASCTKIVSSQALDLLWRDMTSIVPLFKVIPSFGLSLGSYVSSLFYQLNPSNLNDLSYLELPKRYRA